MLPEGVLVALRNEVGRNVLAVRIDNPAPIDRYTAKRGGVDQLRQTTSGPIHRAGADQRSYAQ